MVGRASGGGNNATAFGGVQARAPRLEIKKDVKGMVSVPGATIIEVPNCRNPPLSVQAVMAFRAQKAAGWCCCMQTLSHSLAVAAQFKKCLIA